MKLRLIELMANSMFNVWKYPSALKIKCSFNLNPHSPTQHCQISCLKIFNPSVLPTLMWWVLRADDQALHRNKYQFIYTETKPFIEFSIEWSCNEDENGNFLLTHLIIYCLWLWTGHWSKLSCFLVNTKQNNNWKWSNFVLIPLRVGSCYSLNKTKHKNISHLSVLILFHKNHKKFLNFTSGFSTIKALWNRTNQV